MAEAFDLSEFDKWLPIKSAVELVAAEQQHDRAIRTIVGRLTTDQIKARAERLFISEKPHTQTHVLVPVWLTNWKPKSQTEIENAMLDWAAEQGLKLGPTSVKIPAKKLLGLTRK